MLKYYVASSLENIEAVRRLHALLRAAGWACSYDWTPHGPVFKPEHTSARNVADMADVAERELTGIAIADIVLVLLPGGRGTHVELGTALGLARAARWRMPPAIMIAGTHDQWSPLTGVPPAGNASAGAYPWPCAFYHLPGVRHLTGATENEVFVKVIHAFKMVEEWRLP